MYDDDRHYDKYNYWEFEASPETLDYTVTVYVGYEIDHEDGKKFPILDHAYILDMNGKEIEYILSNTESERVIDEIYEAIYADPRDEPDYYY